MFKGIKLLNDNKIDTVSAKVKITKDQVVIETDIAADVESVVEVEKEKVSSDEVSI